MVLCKILGFSLGGGLTGKMGEVHKNFISFASMLNWKEALLLGGRQLSVDMNFESLTILKIDNIKFAANSKFLKKIRPRRGSLGRGPLDAMQLSKRIQIIP